MNHPGLSRVRNVLSILILVLGMSVQVAAAAWNPPMKLTISNQKSGEIYLTAYLNPGDEISYGWEHSFEHVTWNEYYTVREDGTLKLNSIAVGGFGAGIPAEMDCTYRYGDGLIYMENLENSEFEEIRWIHSQTQVKFIALNGETLVTGPDLPQREKIKLKVTGI